MQGKSSRLLACSVGQIEWNLLHQGSGKKVTQNRGGYFQGLAGGFETPVPGSMRKTTILFESWIGNQQKVARLDRSQKIEASCPPWIGAQ